MTPVDVKQQQRNQHWSQASREYRETWRNARPEGQLYKEIEAELLAEFTEAGSGKKILDLCCGAGRNTLALARTGARMWGLDGAEGMLEMARESAAQEGLEDIEFVLGDARSVPFDDAMFDGVVGTRFMYMMDEGEKRRVINECYRVLKPGGKVVLHFNNRFWGLWRELLNLFAGKRFRIKDRYLSPRQAKSLFKEFRVDAVVGVKLNRLALLSRVIGTRAARRLNRLARRPGFRHLSAYLLVAATKTREQEAGVRDQGSVVGLQVSVGNNQ